MTEDHKLVEKIDATSEAQRSSECWGGFIKDGRAACEEVQLEQFITRHIRDSLVDHDLRGIIKGVFLFDDGVVIYCDRCKIEHKQLLLDDDTAIMALKQFYSDAQVSFSEWANKQSKAFQQGLHYSANSITLIPPIAKIIEARHRGAWIGQT